MKQIFYLKGVKMKKGLFLLASITMLMLAGCGESGSASAGSATNDLSANTGGNTITETPIVTNAASSATKADIETKLGVAIPDFSRQ
jgi:ABC-type glycerol-3-phosphate transport system substrate-binding protein